MEAFILNYIPTNCDNIHCLLFWLHCLFSKMEQHASLPQFTEDKRIQSQPVHLAKYSRDGKLLAIVHTDLSLSIWDSEDILVNTFEQPFFEPKSKNRNNSHHVVFLDWSATNKYLYLIVDCSGFQVDVYSKTKRTHNFTYLLMWYIVII